jgi:membrane fusion protein (multidrug efflux system)
LAAAQAKLDQAKAEEAMSELYVSYTQIKAPFDGVIDRLKFKSGSLIDEGTLLTTLSNNKEVYAYFNVSEQDYLGFKAKDNNNDKSVVSLILANNQPHKYKGKIETIEGEFDSNTGSIPFRAKFPNPELLLKHGETGKVQLTMAIQNAMLIPQKATYELQDKIYVYVVDANNVVKSRNIVIKQKLPNFYVVESGINAGERFLLEGIQYVKDDDKIEPINTPIEQVVATYKNN